ncbi:Non-heme chloroperoxidase [Roseovarius albus]|uniref:Non-heme chloroperoxidase n=1 Tax=Roseovarius albus TaxID=1247867 RepID=A0A1X6ZIY2_9RHOB|nr:alpha/beta hydrolase [Roseovarius albus]SLN52533.1 Non-heme chloroperoxidase [Roseovarius albus]
MPHSYGPFVLIHGACHGGWCWDQVAAHLRTVGCRVYTPTLRGLGDRAHLLTGHTDIAEMGEDIVQLIDNEDLQDAILVGHSFGGSVVTYIADQIGARLNRLIYLDALWIESGQSIYDTMAPDLVAARRDYVSNYGGGIAYPPPPPEAFGITEPDQVSELKQKLTPHPIASYENRLHLKNPVMNGIPADYIMCTNPMYEPLSSARTRVRELGIPIHKLAAPHDAMITHPKLTADLLLSLSAN